MAAKPQTPLSGQLLLADFQTVFTAQVMAMSAQQAADQSESQLMNDLTALGQGTYLQPGGFDADSGQYLSRSSLDAHIKKVQAQQLQVLSASQIDEIAVQAQTAYTGRKVVIIPLDPGNVPFDSIWFDPQNGYRASHMKRAKRITGKISELLLDQNTIVLTPPRSQRLLNRALQQYRAYIIDPESLQPMVAISIV